MTTQATANILAVTQAIETIKGQFSMQLVYIEELNKHLRAKDCQIRMLEDELVKLKKQLGEVHRSYYHLLEKKIDK